jgi:uncharacterized phage protein gp47/JayE
MTFVAQPYERFVDDLLMALTGGTIREEHEFTGIDRAYSLGRPDAVAESLQAFGQRDGEFAVFEQGVDYRYDPVEDALAWHLDGRPPDDRTTFYVSYFTEDASSRLTDRNPGSVTTTLAEAFGRQYAVLHKEMELIYESAFVDLASGSALEHVAALLDVTRKDARFASGEVLLRRSTPAPGDIAIAVGTLVSTPEGQVFEATAPRTLRRDQLSAVVPVRAQVEGPAGAVPPGAITIVNRPIFGIEGVLNERATFFAAERETDEELRRRIRGRIHRAGRSTLDAIRTSLIDGVPDVTEANVQVTEHADSPGYVEVRLGVTGEGDEHFVRSVDEAILAARPAGVRVRHNLSAPGPAVAPPPAAPAAEGIPRDEVVADLRSAGGPEPAATVPGSADGAATVLPIRVEILLRLVEANLTATEREAVESTVRTAVMGYVEALAMGAPLVHAKLLGLAVAPEEVADASMVVIALTAEGEQPSYRVNVIAEGRKLTVEPHDVAIYLMDQPVRLDVRVLVEGDGEVTGPVNAAARAAVERVAGEARTITRDAMRAAVAESLTDLGLRPVEHDAVVVNAMYEETGRVLSDAAEIALADHEVPTVGTVEVAKLGVLDG